MQFRELGKTGLIVSRVGLGLAALGRPGYINLGRGKDLADRRDALTMEEQARTVLDSAWAGGVRYFDAARSYGRAEEFLSRWLHARGIAESEVVVGSKWGYTYTAGWKIDAEKHEIKDHSFVALKRQSAESRQMLGPFLKLFQIHSATIDSGVLEDRAVLEELARLRAEGLKIGLSLSGPRQSETLKRALEVHVSNQGLFDSVQATWNLLEPSVGSALVEANALGVGVIVKEALANGRLTERNGEPSFHEKRRVLEAVAARFGTTLDALALGAATARPWADVVLSGAATADQLRSNLNGLALPWDEELEAMLAPLAENPEEYWKTRAALPWN